MRKLSLFLLLASAAVPALAAPGDDNGNGRHHRDNGQSEQSDSRPQRVREVQQSNAGNEQRNVRVERVERSQVQATQSNRSGFDQMRERMHQQREQQVQAATTQSGSGERSREWRQRNTTSGGQANWQGRQNSNWQSGQNSWQDRQRQVRTVPNTNVASGPSRTEQQLYQNRHRSDYRNGNYSRWTNNWRSDRRYDWNNYRNYHRSTFRIGIYSDPFGWNYRPWSVGSYLYPSYYDQNFWLDDPWQYRLPPAYGPYRWVRYWDDALLVNIYTGQVEDVIHNFFW